MTAPAANTDELLAAAVEACKRAGYLHNGDLAVITAGVPRAQRHHQPLKWKLFKRHRCLAEKSPLRSSTIFQRIFAQFRTY